MFLLHALRGSQCRVCFLMGGSQGINFPALSLVISKPSSPELTISRVVTRVSWNFCSFQLETWWVCSSSQCLPAASFNILILWPGLIWLIPSSESRLICSALLIKSYWYKSNTTSTLSLPGVPAPLVRTCCKSPCDTSLNVWLPQASFVRYQ